jgi:hypothetical protein
METQRTRTLSLSLREVSVLLVVAAFIAGTFMQQARQPVASAETRFTEKSAGGILIVPASCPSSPHYSGECSGGVLPEETSCTIWADSYGVTAGESVTLYWSASDSWFGETGSISPTIGSVDPISGSQSVSPTVTTNYEFVVAYGGGESCEADLTITVTEGDVCANISGEQTSAPAHAYVSGNNCVCDSGYYLSGGQCLPEDDGACTPSYFCSGDALNYRNAQCAESTIQTCSYACSAGACILPPDGEGNITATPGLVRSGNTTTVAWTTSDMTSCTVTENSGDISDSWTGTTGSEESSDITEQTVYTLQCTRGDETTFTDRATVNIIPTFCETDAQGNCPD